MGNVLLIAGAIAEISVAVGILWGGLVWFSKIIEGLKCQLRTAMLRTYYECKDSKKIRQYEAENFKKNYNAYKALKGNSFIDDINDIVKTFEVIT